MRRAQRALMADKATVHPYYWAAFLLFLILFIQRRPRGLFPQRGRAAES